MPPSGRARRYISDEFIQVQLVQKPPMQVPHDETEGDLSESGAGTASGSSSAAPGQPHYARSSRIRCTKRSTSLPRRNMHGRRYKYLRVISENVWLMISLLFQVCGCAESEREGEGGPACEGSSCDAEHAQEQPDRILLHYVHHSGQTLHLASIWLEAKIESDKMVFKEYVAELKLCELVRTVPILFW